MSVGSVYDNDVVQSVTNYIDQTVVDHMINIHMANEHFIRPKALR